MAPPTVLDTGETPPRITHQRKMNKERVKYLEEQVDQILVWDIVEPVPTGSPLDWLCNVVMVKQEGRGDEILHRPCLSQLSVDIPRLPHCQT